MAGRYGYVYADQTNVNQNNVNHTQGERKQRIYLSRDDFPELFASAARRLDRMHANLDRQDALRQASKQAEHDRKAAAKAVSSSISTV